MTRFAIFLLASSLAIAGCATVPGPIEDRESGTTGGMCAAQPGQRFIGQTASSDTGAAILAATGARTLRWGPPDAVFTMDFRQDRVNVMYNAELRITEIRCG